MTGEEWIKMYKVKIGIWNKDVFIDKAYDVINSQKAQITELQHKNSELEHKIAYCNTENERLRIANTEAYSSGFEVGKITARKEFAERLNNVKSYK